MEPVAGPSNLAAGGAEDENGDAMDRWLRAAEPTSGGMVRGPRYIHRIEWSFLVCVLVSLTVSASLAMYSAITANQSVPQFLTFMLYSVFAVYNAIHSVFGERPPEMVCFVTSYALFSGVLLVEWLCHYNKYLLSAAVVTWIGAVPNLILGVKLWQSYRRSQNLLLRTVADRLDLLGSVNAVYRFRALLVLEFQLSLILITIVCYYRHGDDLIFSPWVVGFGIPVSVLTLCLGFFLTSWEHGSVVIFYLLSSFYFLVLVALQMYHAFTSFRFLVTQRSTLTNLPLVSSVTCVGAVGVHIALMAALFRVWRNYGKGVGSTIRRPRLRTLTCGPASVHSGSSGPYPSYDTIHMAAD